MLRRTLQTVDEPGTNTYDVANRYEFVVLLQCPDGVKKWSVVNKTISVSVFC